MQGAPVAHVAYKHRKGGGEVEQNIQGILQRPVPVPSATLHWPPSHTGVPLGQEQLESHFEGSHSLCRRGKGGLRKVQRGEMSRISASIVSISSYT